MMQQSLFCPNARETPIDIKNLKDGLFTANQQTEVLEDCIFQTCSAKTLLRSSDYFQETSKQLK